MKQEDKQLLLVDLCSRLPYNVKCQFEDTIRVTDGESDPFYDYILSARNLDLFINHKNFYIKPYLRPMSSMTEEEWEELNSIGYIVPLYDGCFGVDMRAYCKNNQPHYRRFSDFSTIEDWLNAHHFDYRGLIEKGLAFEAPEGMYGN